MWRLKSTKANQQAFHITVLRGREVKKFPKATALTNGRDRTDSPFSVFRWYIIKHHFKACKPFLPVLVFLWLPMATKVSVGFIVFIRTHRSSSLITSLFPSLKFSLQCSKRKIKFLPKDPVRIFHLNIHFLFIKFNWKQNLNECYFFLSFGIIFL